VLVWDYKLSIPYTLGINNQRLVSKQHSRGQCPQAKDFGLETLHVIGPLDAPVVFIHPQGTFLVTQTGQVHRMEQIQTSSVVLPPLQRLRSIIRIDESLGQTESLVLSYQDGSSSLHVTCIGQDECESFVYPSNYVVSTGNGNNKVRDHGIKTRDMIDRHIAELDKNRQGYGWIAPDHPLMLRHETKNHWHMTGSLCFACSGMCLNELAATRTFPSLGIAQQVYSRNPFCTHPHLTPANRPRYIGQLWASSERALYAFHHQHPLTRMWHR
jgi:hypothetical protein